MKCSSCKEFKEGCCRASVFEKEMETSCYLKHILLRIHNLTAAINQGGEQRQRVLKKSEGLMDDMNKGQEWKQGG